MAEQVMVCVRQVDHAPEGFEMFPDAQTTPPPE